MGIPEDSLYVLLFLCSISFECLILLKSIERLEEDPVKVYAEDNEWEDIPATRHKDLTAHQVGSSEKLASLQAAPRQNPGSLRKRRPGQKAVTKTVFVASNGASPRKPVSRPKPAQTPRPTPPLVSREEVQIALTHGTRSSAKYVYDVTTRAFSLLKWPLAVLLVLWAVALILNVLSASVRTAFSPLCGIPGISRFELCRWRHYQYESGREPQQLVLL